MRRRRRRRRLVPQLTRASPLLRCAQAGRSNLKPAYETHKYEEPTERVRFDRVAVKKRPKALALEDADKRRELAASPTPVGVLEKTRVSSTRHSAVAPFREETGTTRRWDDVGWSSTAVRGETGAARHWQAARGIPLESSLPQIVAKPAAPRLDLTSERYRSRLELTQTFPEGRDDAIRRRRETFGVEDRAARDALQTARVHRKLESSARAVAAVEAEDRAKVDLDLARVESKRRQVAEWTTWRESLPENVRFKAKHARSGVSRKRPFTQRFATSIQIG